MPTSEQGDAEACKTDQAQAGPHQISAQSVGKRNLTRMVVVPLSTFAAHGSIPRRSFKTPVDMTAHVPVSDVKAGGKILFFSQRWLTPSGNPASPDDANLTKYKQVLLSAQKWAEQNDVYFRRREQGPALPT